MPDRILCPVSSRHTLRKEGPGLTVESTLANLEALRVLLRHELDPDDDRMPIRTLYVWRPLNTFLSACFPRMQRLSGRLTPLEQVAGAFDRFVGDPNLTGTGEFVCITPQSSRIYEVKMTDVRVFGFFPCPRRFVVTSVALKKNLKGVGSKVKRHRKHAESLAKSMGLPRIKGEYNVRNLL